MPQNKGRDTITDNTVAPLKYFKSKFQQLEWYLHFEHVSSLIITHVLLVEFYNPKLSHMVPKGGCPFYITSLCVGA